MQLKNPITILTGKEKILWMMSLFIVGISNVFSGIFLGDFSFLTLLTALIGVTAVLYEAKGNIWGQIFISVFSVLYGVISWEFRYYGELITYLGMALPMAIAALYTWFTNPSEENPHTVRIQRLTKKKHVFLFLSGVLVTMLFNRVLVYFDTPNIVFGTLSITTSFYAAALTILRSTYYAFWYALNDLVLIVLWMYASTKNPVYIPMIVNFVVFFLNDLYGFYSWKKREKSVEKHYNK